MCSLPYCGQMVSSRWDLTKSFNFFSQILGSTCAAFKFKLIVCTVCAKCYACSVTCDPYQPTILKGFRWALLYIGTVYLIHLIQPRLPFQAIRAKVRTNLYTHKEVPSLKMHRYTSSALFYPVLALQ